MKWLILVLGIMLLTGCETVTSPVATPSEGIASSTLIAQWAQLLEAGNLDQAKTLTIMTSDVWEASTRTALTRGTWRPHRILQLPSDERPYAPPGTLRVQWELDIPPTERYRFLCTDVRERDGKVEAFNMTQYCTSEGVFESNQPE